MEKPQESELGGEQGFGQDRLVIITLIRSSEGCPDEKLSVIPICSHVLTTHSKYFDAYLSERWSKPSSSKELVVQCVLEVQTDVEHYHKCFSNMFSPTKSFAGVTKELELLKVAAQIEYEELVEHISDYLSCVFWSCEDRQRIREYAASPGFCRLHSEDLVARLGIDESEEVREEQLMEFVRECTRGLMQRPKFGALPPFFEGIFSGPPSVISRTVIAVVREEAKNLFDHGCVKDWWYEFAVKIPAVCCILESILTGQVIEDSELLKDLVKAYSSAVFLGRFPALMLPPFFESVICDPPSDVSRTVITVVIEEAKITFANLKNGWHEYYGERINLIGCILDKMRTCHGAEVSEEFYGLVQVYTRAFVQGATGKTFGLPSFFKDVLCGQPSAISRTVILVVSEEAKNLLIEHDPTDFSGERLNKLFYILKALMKGQAVEDVEQLYDLVREHTRSVFKIACCKGRLFPNLLLHVDCNPSLDSQGIVEIVNEEATDMFANIAKEWSQHFDPDFGNCSTEAMVDILEALLQKHVAQELVEALVHLDVIPKCLKEQTLISSPTISTILVHKFARLVHVIFEEAVDGRGLLLRPPEVVALLSNWYGLLKSEMSEEHYAEAINKLFLTLPLKEQIELMHSRKEEVSDYIYTLPLDSLLQSHGAPGLPPK